MIGTLNGAPAYAAQLAALMPRGRAWSRDPDSVLMQLIDASAEALARVDARSGDLADEADPRTTLELLADWENTAGLPDDCFGAPDNVPERQVAVTQRITGLGGQSRAYFTELAARMGYAISIDEFRPARCGDRCGVEIGGADRSFVWRINVLPLVDDLPESQFVLAQAQVGDRCGVRLRGWGAIDLECIIRRHAPAHTTVLFTYRIDPDPLFWIDFTL